MLEVREVAPGMVQVGGRVDLTTASELCEKLGEAVERALEDGMPTLSIDLHEVQMVDATGLGVLLGAHRRARRGGGRLRLVRLSPALSELLLVSRLYRVLDIGHSEAGGSGSPAAGVLRVVSGDAEDAAGVDAPPSARTGPAGERPYASS